MGICKTQQEDLDINYLRYWAKELDILELLQRAFEDSGLTEVK